MDKKKIVGGLITIGATVALLVGATLAYFSDSGTSTNNVFSAGNLDLKLTDKNETSEDNVTASFGGDKMAPGECVPATGSATLKLKNTGTVDGNHVDLSFTNTNATMSAQLRVDLLTYDGGDLLSSISNSNANSYIDLADLQASGIVNQPLTDLDHYHTLAMRVCLDKSTGNEFQNQSDTLDINVFLNQGPHSSE